MSDEIEDLINAAEEEKGSPLTGAEVDAIVEANYRNDDGDTTVIINPAIHHN